MTNLALHKVTLCIVFLIIGITLLLHLSLANSQNIELERRGSKYQVVDYEQLYNACCSFGKRDSYERHQFLGVRIATMGVIDDECKLRIDDYGSDGKGTSLRSHLHHPRGTGLFSYLYGIQLVIDKINGKGLPSEVLEKERAICTNFFKDRSLKRQPIGPVGVIVYGQMLQGKDLPEDLIKKIYVGHPIVEYYLKLDYFHVEYLEFAEYDLGIGERAGSLFLRGLPVTEIIRMIAMRRSQQ